MTYTIYKSERFFASVLLNLGLLCGTAVGQNFPQRGFLPFAPIESSGTADVNVNTGTLIYRVPLYKFPIGSGGSSFDIGLIYNSAIFDPTTASSNIQSSSTGGGWSYGVRYQLTVENAPPSGCTTKAYRYSVIYPDGSRHLLHLKGLTTGPLKNLASVGDSGGYYDIDPGTGIGTCTGQTLSGTLLYYTDDGTFARLEITTATGNPWTLFLPDGVRVSGVGVNGFGDTVTDRNGNSVLIVSHHGLTASDPSYIQITDSLNRSVKITTPLNPDGTSTDTITAKGFNDAILTWTINWSQYSPTDGGTYQTSCPPPSTATCTITPSVTAISDIQLPSVNGEALRYKFTYTTNPGWGELSSVVTPYGATISYVYADGMNVHYRPSDDPNVPITTKTLTWRETANNPNSTTAASRTQVWTYAIQPGATNGSTSTITTSILKPDGGTISFTYCLPSGGSSRVLCKTQQPNTDAEELVWRKNCPFQIFGSQPGNPYVKTRFRTVKATSMGGTDQTAITDYNYDRNGNLLGMTEYDWVATSTTRDSSNNLQIPVAAPILRVTANTYSPSIGSALDSNTSASCGASTLNDTDDVNAYWFTRSGNTLRTLTSSVVTDAANGKMHMEFGYDNATTTANVTSERNWRSVSSAGTAQADSTPLANNYIETTHTYDANGNLLSTTDPNSIKTSYQVGGCTYTDSALRTYKAYATKITIGQATSYSLARDTTQTWDCSGGLVTLSTDPNLISQATSYDAIGRITQRNEASGNALEVQTRFGYAESNTLNSDNTLSTAVIRATLTSGRDRVTKGDGLIITNRRVNQLGQPVISKSADVSRYDLSPLADGSFSYAAVSTPYFSSTSGETTFGWIRKKFDRNGRVVATDKFVGVSFPYPWNGTTDTTPDTKSTISYDANIVIMNDEDGKERRNTFDGAGRLKSVKEDPGGLNYLTSYVYDFGDRVKTVTQGSQTRQFTYDSLGSLLSANNPETGTVNYLYDENGNLISRKDGSNITTSLSYDALNRITRRSYSDSTGAVTYCYDGDLTNHVAPETPRNCANGGTGSNVTNRLTMVKNAASTNGYQYDALGRFTTSTQITNGTSYPFVYGYANNLLQSPATVKYPTGRVVATTYDNAERVTAVASGSTTYAMVNSFASHGAVTQVTLGNGLIETISYNSHLQPTQMKVGSLLTLDFEYSTTANGTTSNNNGNLRKQIITRGAFSATQSYSYDAVNRLKIVAENSPTPNAPLCPDSATNFWCQSYGYDAYGNRLINSRMNLTMPTSEPTGFSALTNRNSDSRWSASNFDASGNIVLDPDGVLYTYDAENRQTTAGASIYFYDGDGRRIARNANMQTITYVYDAFGRLAAEYGSGAFSGSPLYLSTDHLGSTRLITDRTGNTSSCRDFRPFGERIDSVVGQPRAALVCYSSDPGVSQQFTSKERDAETGLDYFGARYMSSAQGRFTSPDPLMASANVGDPQSWNRYTYGRNNPLRYNDPLGLFPSPAYNCSEAQTNCLNDDQRRILENSSVKVGKETLSGEKLWNAVGSGKNGEAIQNAFVNVTDRLGSIQLAGGGTALGGVSSVTSLEPDRIKANVSSGVFDTVSTSKGFQAVSGALHPGFDFKSFKSRENEGNIQFSFGPPRANGRPGMADIDHDLYQDWRHAFEVIQNHATGGTTNQDSIRQLLLRRPEIGITPSTDPKFNRKP